MTDLEKARVMKCLSRFIQQVVGNRDPEGANKLREEWNCANGCNSFKYCQQLEDTLEGR